MLAGIVHSTLKIKSFDGNLNYLARKKKEPRMLQDKQIDKTG